MRCCTQGSRQRWDVLLCIVKAVPKRKWHMNYAYCILYMSVCTGPCACYYMCRTQQTVPGVLLHLGIWDRGSTWTWGLGGSMFSWCWKPASPTDPSVSAPFGAEVLNMCMMLGFFMSVLRSEICSSWLWPNCSQSMSHRTNPFIVYFWYNTQWEEKRGGSRKEGIKIKERRERKIGQTEKA